MKPEKPKDSPTPRREIPRQRNDYHERMRYRWQPVGYTFEDDSRMPVSGSMMIMFVVALSIIIIWGTFTFFSSDRLSSWNKKWEDNLRELENAPVRYQFFDEFKRPTKIVDAVSLKKAVEIAEGETEVAWVRPSVNGRWYGQFIRVGWFPSPEGRLWGFRAPSPQTK